ncbi:hypothetical protein [Paraburkholderia sp. SIMBA_030]|uniref:hypothetical protein n=1 Tax=Paraburkholderia sp. SIMBA_030 TaxID=3085773 RepID=UPI0039795AE2
MSGYGTYRAAPLCRVCLQARGRSANRLLNAPKVAERPLKSRMYEKRVKTLLY